ncbi:hypothetical protein JCM30566_19670 [Marinitoga arctica]
MKKIIYIFLVVILLPLLLFLIYLKVDVNAKIKKNNLINETYKYLEKYYYKNLDTNSLLTNLLSGLNNKYVGYLESGNKKYNHEYSLGFYFHYDYERFVFTVDFVIKNSEAYKKGIKPNDMIIEIDNNKIIDIGPYKAVKLLDSKEIVDLTIVRKELDTPRKIILNKKYNTIPTAVFTKFNFNEENIGYIKINYFEQGNTVKEVSYILQEITLKKIKYLIIDLRYNLGGDFDEGIKVLSYFTDKKILGKIIYKNQSKIIYRESIPFFNNLNNIKKIILVNKFTVSTAEFFTQFFKENKLATVVGEKTYGKSELIGYFNLENGGTVFFPIGYFVSEKGKNISKTGIYPDIYVDDPNFGIFLDSKNLENDTVIKKALDFIFEYEKNKQYF